jgi:hypothetical protein
MPDTSEERRFIKLSDACLVLNRDPLHVQEFLEGSEIELETVDDELCIDLDALIEHITDVAMEMAA